MKVKIKPLRDGMMVPFQAREGDFCYDVVAVAEEEIAPNVWKYYLGFAYEIVREPIVTGEWEERFGVFIKEINDDGTFKCEDNVNKRSITIHDMYFNKVKLSIDFRPRSSVYKTGMILSNCVGTLDEMYRGEMFAIFYHVMPNMPRYRVGDRIGQIKLGITLPLEFEVVDEINMNTERGTGGMGSTGK